MNHDYHTIERLAAQLCHMAGGVWERKRTKRNLWRGRAMALVAMAHGDMPEAKRIMGRA